MPADASTPRRGRRKAAPATAGQAIPVVGVGASAGGLDAFRKLLAALPADTGLAYVLVQHLDPRHESVLPDLLARDSRLPVTEVREDTAVEPDHVYVCPGQHDVTIDANTLKLIPRDSTRGQHLPIDSFLRALAAERGPRAIGVILSGTASDGTLGVKAIKAEGGITFAQEPESAAYDGMPRSAMASGAIDFVLRPDRIALEIARLSRHPYVAEPSRDEPSAGAPRPPPEEPDGLHPILGLLRKATGVDFAAYRPQTIRRRLARRMALAHIETLDDYARHLQEHPAEVQALYQDCLIHVTSFFRDPDAFEALCATVVPDMLQDRPSGRPVRVWVPGCATGEEAYSIVICLLERAGQLRANPTFQVFATDLAESALDKARAGSYPASIAQDVSPERLRRFFVEVDGHYQVSKAIRDMCVFARHDLARDPPFSRMDLISCRNVLIYLEPRLQQRLLATFHYSLQPSGFLLLGSSESGGASPDLFASVDKRHRIYSKRPAATGPLVSAGYYSTEGRQERGTTGASAPARGEDIAREADRVLLARHAPPSVILDDKDNVVEFRGPTGPYLEHAQGRATFNIFKIARKGLVVDLRQVIQEARKKDGPARKEGIGLRQGRQVHWLDVEAVPLRGTAQLPRPLLVTFEPKREAPPEPQVPRSNGNRGDARENVDLRRQLAEATQYMQAMTQEHDAASEELQAANEEVLSANEELQSINEELETTKEELQSTNEELTTLNHELNERNLQVGRALDYANGIVETVHNPLLVLDADMRVVRANQAFYDYFQVAAPDTIGRRVYELGKGHWDVTGLRAALEEVLPRDMRVVDFEVEQEFPRLGPRTMSLNARTVRDGAGDRILLAIEDLTDSRKLEREQEALLSAEQEARKKAEHTDRIKDEFVATLSHELRGPLNAMVGWVTVLRGRDIDSATRVRGMEAIERGCGPRPGSSRSCSTTRASWPGSSSSRPGSSTWCPSWTRRWVRCAPRPKPRASPSR